MGFLVSIAVVVSGCVVFQDRKRDLCLPEPDLTGNSLNYSDWLSPEFDLLTEFFVTYGVARLEASAPLRAKVADLIAVRVAGVTLTVYRAHHLQCGGS